MAFAGEPAPPVTLSGAAASRKDHRRSAAHAAASGSRFPQLADRYAEQADEGRSPSGSAVGWNLAIATGAPGPDVLDVEAGNGYGAFARLERAGLVGGAAAYVRTPVGGMHAYFTGSGQHNSRLPSLWVPNTVSPHATWAYSWIRPPSLSRRMTRIFVTAAGGLARPAGGFWCSVRWGRCVL